MANSYDRPPPNLAGSVFRLVQFHRIGGHAFVSRTGRLREVADTQSLPERSKLLIYEDDKLLGPPHSAHADISSLGNGRFSHWDTAGGFIISTSDNSDPNLNGRQYWVVTPR